MSSQVTSVPLLDLPAQYQPIREEVLAAITRVCDSQRFIMGPEVEGLERELAQMLEVKHAVGVSSGTDALLAAMMALSIGPGDEVITSTYSFFATAGCVVTARRDAGARRHRPGHLQHRSGGGGGGDHAADARPSSRCTCTASADMTPDPGGRREVRRRGDRGRGAGHRHALPWPARRRARHDRLLLVLPEQEPRRVR